MTKLNTRTRLAQDFVRFVCATVGVIPAYLLATYAIPGDGWKVTLWRVVITTVVVMTVKVAVWIEEFLTNDT